MTASSASRLIALCAACIGLSGCINWQSAYDSAARRDCADIIAADARQECLAQVERNASERRAEHRS